MTTYNGNRAWRALSDECEPEPDDGFDTLPRMVQRAIARGTITLAEALELASTDPDDELCPACGCRPIATERGLCRVCQDRLLVDGLYQKLAEIDSHRAHDVAKQQVHRARVELGLPLPRAGTRSRDGDAKIDVRQVDDRDNESGQTPSGVAQHGGARAEGNARA